MDLRILLESSLKGGIINVPSSKSISNRVLILNALADNTAELSNLSEARDTVLMQSLLMSNEAELNAKDAGTTYRFLTSFLAMRESKTTRLLGEERMYQRPIGVLVGGLRELGGQVTYLEKEGFPPLLIEGKKLTSNKVVHLDGSISSQFLSSLVMIGPYVEHGLEIHLLPPVASEPYLRMTIELMRDYGAKVDYDGQRIKVHPGSYRAKEFTVETDWSGACFFYALASLGDVHFGIENLQEKSLQADQAIVPIMESLGVKTIYDDDGVIFRGHSKDISEELRLDCLKYPDLVPALMVALGMHGVSASLTSTQHLAYKESDRGQALINELTKTGVDISSDDGIMKISGKCKVITDTVFESYKDHRMAMCLSLLAYQAPIIIKDAEVVEKSFPNYWIELAKAGFRIEEII